VNRELPPDDQAGDLLPIQADSPVVDRINPDSVLPIHLQRKSFDRDIWDRVKNHPIKNPIFTTTKLKDDVESREIVRQVMSAANEREKEVLLHNQHRVFREILGRMVDRVGDFLSTPLVPRTWIAGADAPRVLSPAVAAAPFPDPGDEEQADGEQDAADISEKWYQTVVASVLTPKYFLLGVVILLGLVAGYKQIQVKNLQEAVDSYKLAAEASSNLQNEMRGLVTSTQNERDERRKERDETLTDLANVRSQLMEANGKIAAREQNIASLTADNTKLTEEVGKFHEKQSSSEKALQAKLEASEKARTTAEKSLAEASATNAGLREDRQRLDASEKEKRELIDKKDREIDGLRKSYSDQFYQRSQLETERTVLRFAETALYNIRQEANTYWGGTIEKAKVRQYLGEFDVAKQNVLNQTRQR
jgi:hypothetical protein